MSSKTENNFVLGHPLPSAVEAHSRKVARSSVRIDNHELLVADDFIYLVDNQDSFFSWNDLHELADRQKLDGASSVWVVKAELELGREKLCWGNHDHLEV